MKTREKRLQMARHLEHLAVLEDELAALHIWQSAKNSSGALALPDEIWDGMTISIDKIETVLRNSEMRCPAVSGRKKYGEQCRE